MHFHGADTTDVMDAVDGKVPVVHDVLDPVDAMDTSSI